MANKEIKNNDTFYGEFTCADHHNENEIEKPGTFGGNASAVAVAKSTKSRIIIFEGQQIVFEFNGGENGEIYLEYIRGPPGHYNGLVPKSIPISDKKDDVKDDQIDNKFKKTKKPKIYNESHIIPKIKLTNYWSALETEESDTDCEDSEDKESISNKEEIIHDAKRAKVEVEPGVEGEATVEVEATIELKVVSGQSGDIQLPGGVEFRTIYFTSRPVGHKY